MKVAKQSVELIDSMGSDLSVVNAARVSFDKISDYPKEVDVYGKPLKNLLDKDVKLLSYLAKHNHWSPFAHTSLSFRIKAPIFVARQLAKHQVGGAWNEVSRRYVDSEPEFYFPEVWRKKADNVKQGSSDESVNLRIQHAFDETGLVDTPFELCEGVLNHYQELLRQGVCPEQARMVLPQSTMTEWIWTGSLAFFARVCKLRLDSHTQRETQDVAKQIEELTSKVFPVSFKALMEN
jgi:thymidylate synthase (FAD)